MKIQYLQKATTDVRARTKIELGWLPDAGSQNVLVEVLDTSDQVVVTAEIEMYITKRK